MTAVEIESATPFLVVAFRPSAYLEKLISQAKVKTREIAGDQIYLAHPPHLTLYVAAFDQPEMVVERCRDLVRQWKRPVLELSGWHHFGGDVLTGNETLVCRLSNESMASLRGYQQALLSVLADLRNSTLSASRYRPHFASLTPQRQLAVEEYGFPFIGEDWTPHFTIASIAKQNWEAVWLALEGDPPQGQATCDTLAIFLLRHDFPHAWQEIPL